MKNLLWCALVVFALGTVAAAADEKVDNPAYKVWASYKPGTMVKHQMTSEMNAGGQNITQKITTTATLKEITPDKAVVEMSIAMGGGASGPAPQKLEIPAKVSKEAASAPAAPEGVKLTKKGEGDEEITVAGKKYKAHWEEYTMSSDQYEATMKTWKSDQVPGGMLKVETTMTKPMKSKSSTELVEFKPAS